MDHSIFQLPNGIRVVFYPQKAVVTHTCLLINAGSRDEETGLFGIAHLIEHMLFKRTEKRNTSRIINRIESVGGDLNAYTTKEYTCIHASVLSNYLERVLDLFEDIVFHSTFPEWELQKEKQVIFDEISSYLDSPEESIMDDFEDLLFSGSGLGHNILGAKRDLSTLSSRDILQFIQRNYRTDEMVIGITGDYKPAKVKKLVERFFGNVVENLPDRKRDTVILTKGKHLEVEKPIHQVHYMLGVQGYGMHHPKKMELLLLNNILGGAGMSSVLNLAVREKYGIAYTIESHYGVYSDTGIFSIYMGTDKKKYEKAVRLIYKELRKIKNQPLSSYKLQKAKQKIKGQIALAEENRLGMIISDAKNVLDYGRVIGIEEVFQRIENISNESLTEVAQEVFQEDHFFSLQYLPIEG
ncbi:MAG TPA: pitrilysin family protein [Sphingobacterium sp.]|nr:pitrilysin family protein [Sphingobacterium sp.]